MQCDKRNVINAMQSPAPTEDIQGGTVPKYPKHLKHLFYNWELLRLCKEISGEQGAG